MTDVPVTLQPLYLCPSEGHKHGVSIQSSINLGDTLPQITHEWKTTKTWILAMLLIYQTSIVSQVLDFIHWTINNKAIPIKCFVSHRPPSHEGGSVSQAKKKEWIHEGFWVLVKAGLLSTKAWLRGPFVHNQMVLYNRNRTTKCQKRLQKRSIDDNLRQLML